MAITLTAHTAGGSPDNTTLTTPSLNTTGCDLIVLVFSSFAGNPRPTITDSKGNTFTALTSQTGSVVRSTILYCESPTVGAGHTWSVNSANTYPAICALGFTGAALSSAFDVQNGAGTGGATSLAASSVTPSVDNEVVVTGMAINVADTPTIGGGFTVSDHVTQDSGHCIGAHGAYLIQTTATAANPTWSWATSTEVEATIATFKAATGGGGGGSTGGPLLGGELLDGGALTHGRLIR